MQGTKVVRPFPFFRAGARASQPQLSKPILTLEDVYKFFRPDQPTLRGVNLSVERGEFASNQAGACHGEKVRHVWDTSH